jgi:hypothetical protein
VRCDVSSTVCSAMCGAVRCVQSDMMRCGAVRYHTEHQVSRMEKDLLWYTVYVSESGHVRGVMCAVRCSAWHQSILNLVLTNLVHASGRSQLLSHIKQKEIQMEHHSDDEQHHSGTMAAASEASECHGTIIRLVRVMAGDPTGICPAVLTCVSFPGYRRVGRYLGHRHLGHVSACRTLPPIRNP